MMKGDVKPFRSPEEEDSFQRMLRASEALETDPKRARRIYGGRLPGGGEYTYETYTEENQPEPFRTVRAISEAFVRERTREIRAFRLGLVAVAVLGYVLGRRHGR